MKLFFIYLFSMVVMLSACNSNPTTEHKIPKLPAICSVIFMDKSVSVDVNKDFVHNKYSQLIQQVVEQNLQQKGDKIEVYFIHENTSKARALSLICRSELDESSNTNSTDTEAAKAMYDLSIGKERSNAIQRIIALLNQRNTAESRHSTDIISGFSIVDKLSNEGYGVKAYFFSDMIESMKGNNRRDFHHNPPTNNEQASKWAIQDAPPLKSQLLGISSAQFYVALPFEPTSGIRQNNPTIMNYWNTLLAEIGVGGTFEEL